MYYIADKKGLYFKGEIGFCVSGDKYRLSHNPPLYLNVIKKTQIEAFPTDQGGGMRGGDSHRYTVSLDSSANVVWYSPASTLCYPSMYGSDDCCNLKVNINLADSNLIFVNKPLIPCKDSNIRQDIEIKVDSKSSLLYWDEMSSGRVAHEEQWKFLNFENKLSLSCDNILAYKENWTLKKGMIPSSLAGFGESCIYATGIFYNDAIKKIDVFKHICNESKCTYSVGKIYDNLFIIKLIDKTGIGLNNMTNQALSRKK